MGTIFGTSTTVSYGTTTVISRLDLVSSDLSYIVILLMVLVAIGLVDLFRRIFTRR